ncbi:MAG TPA: cytochrome c peroxidase [Dongiaceae bacterium]|nr:cytochrome c peroxidase [Dongiaceae bacterium]
MIITLLLSTIAASSSRAEQIAPPTPPSITEPAAAATAAADTPATTQPVPLNRMQAYAQAKALAAIGARLFMDPHLSGSGQMACSSCHAPDNAFAQNNDRAVQLGGGDLHDAGLRAVPSLKYLQAVPQFSEHFFDSEDEADESVDNGPTGGLTWDGRADSKMDQARIPLLSSFEMGNRSADDVVDAADKGGYLVELAKILGPAATRDKAAAFNAVLLALQVYQEDPAVFYPYDSKYDAYLAGKVALTPQEQRGLVAFTDENKGNCSSCHIAERALDGSAPQFTDYGLIAIGLPRNPAIPANSDPSHFDLGLCGPQRTDLKDHADYCGLFRTPTLRNVATRHVFFHNGFIHSLRDAVAFYATRDSDPGRWYPKRADGSIDKFNDLPERYRGNLNTDPPFDDKPGHPQRLTDAEIDDIVAFLKTLTDGYRP